MEPTYSNKHKILMTLAGLAIIWIAYDMTVEKYIFLPLVAAYLAGLIPGFGKEIIEALRKNDRSLERWMKSATIFVWIYLSLSMILLITLIYIKYIHSYVHDDALRSNSGVATLNWEMIGAIGQCASAIVGMLGLAGLIIVIYQVTDTRKWNRLSTTFDAMPNPIELEELESEIDEVIMFWKRDERDPISDLEVKAMFGKSVTDDEIGKLRNRYSWHHGVTNENMLKKIEFAGRKFKLYMNMIERYCVAINSGIADSETAKMIYGYKFKSHLNKSKIYIENVRRDKGNSTLYIELERVVEVWYPKHQEFAESAY